MIAEARPLPGAVSQTPARGRIALAGLAVFVLIQLSEVALHGFILASDYRPFYGRLLRDAGGQDAAWPFLFLPVVHLCSTIGLVWLCVKVPADARWVRRAVRIGVVAWLLGPAPLYLLWFAEQPWPGTLVVKQLAWTFVVVIVVALAASAVLRPRPAAARA
jgi:hypothetical protein